MYIYYTDEYCSGGQQMKKRIWCIALVLGIATIFSGCGVSSNKKDAETNKTETSTSAKTSKKKSVKNEKDLIYPTRLGSLGWIDSSTVGERICFGPIIGAFSNYQRGSVTNKEENKSKASENGWIDPFNALLIRESFTEERAKDYELKYAEKLEEVPDILRIQKFWGDALSDYAGLGSGDDDKIDIVVDKSDKVNINGFDFIREEGHINFLKADNNNQDVNNAAYYVGYYYTTKGVDPSLLQENSEEMMGMAIFVTFREGVYKFYTGEEKDRGKDITEEQIKALHSGADAMMSTLRKERGHDTFDVY